MTLSCKYHLVLWVLLANHQTGGLYWRLLTHLSYIRKILLNCFNIWKPINVTHYINRVKTKHRFISIDAEKNIWQNPIPIHYKNFNKLGIEGDYLNLIKNIYDKNPTADIIVVRYWSFSTQNTHKAWVTLSRLLFSIMLEFLAKTYDKKKK